MIHDADRRDYTFTFHEDMMKVIGIMSNAWAHKRVGQPPQAPALIAVLSHPHFRQIPDYGVHQQVRTHVGRS